MPPITLHITWQLKPSTTPKFLELVQALIAHVKQEPECLYFNVFHVSEFGPKPGGGHGDTIKLVEMWDPAGTEEERGRWLREVYPKNEAVKTFLAGMEELGYQGRKIEVLAGVEGMRYVKS